MGDIARQHKNAKKNARQRFKSRKAPSKQVKEIMEHGHSQARAEMIYTRHCNLAARQENS